MVYRKFVNITGNTTIDGVLFAFIAMVSFSIAFDLVGKLFDALGFYDAKLMSECHWTIRTIIFVLLTLGFIQIVRWVDSLLHYQWWVYVLFVVGILVLIALTVYLKWKKRNKKK